MKTLIWDFDGTLGYRDGGAWTASLFEVLQREIPESTVTFEQLRPYMVSEGYPWGRPEESHLHLDTPEKWWDALKPLFVNAYLGVGLEPDVAHHLAGMFRETYLTPECWRIYDDVVPTLSALSDAGWIHVILSNHVPELADIVEWVGLSPYIAEIFNSAQLGYEKPHPATFAAVQAKWGSSVDNLWMIGDNPWADVDGAEKAGIPAILIRRFHPDARRYAETLWELPTILEQGE